GSQRGEVGPCYRKGLVLTCKGCYLPREFPCGAIPVFGRRGACRDEEQERGEDRVPPLHGCDDSTRRFSLCKYDVADSTACEARQRRSESTTKPTLDKVAVYMKCHSTTFKSELTNLAFIRNKVIAKKLQDLSR